MSTWNTREQWLYQARDCIAELTNRQVLLPDTVTDALAVLDRVEAAQPVQPEHTAIRQAFLRDASADEINALVLADLGAQKISVEHAQARTEAAGAVLAAVLAGADQIMPRLTELANQAITALVMVADLGTVTLNDLVKSGRNDDASALANVQTVAAELSALYQIRDRYLIKGGQQALTINGINASIWRQPLLASHYISGGTLADQYITGLKKNLGLWYPSRDEAIEVAQAIADEQAAKAQEIASKNHGVGSIAAF